MSDEKVLYYGYSSWEFWALVELFCFLLVIKQWVKEQVKVCFGPQIRFGQIKRLLQPLSQLPTPPNLTYL